MPADKCVKWAGLIYNPWILCVLRNLFGRKDSSPFQVLLLPIVGLQVSCTVIHFPSPRAGLPLFLFLNSKICYCCGVGRNTVTYVQTCVYIHPRGAAVALIWSFFPCQQIRKGLWKSRIPKGSIISCLYRGNTPAGISRYLLYVLYVGSTREIQKERPGKPGSRKHIVWLVSFFYI